MNTKLISVILIAVSLLALLCSCAMNSADVSGGDAEANESSSSFVISGENTEEVLRLMTTPNGFEAKRENVLNLLKEYYPEYVYSEETPVYSYSMEEYKRIYYEGMDLCKTVDTFGVPYDCEKYGDRALCYFTSDGGAVYIIVRSGEKLLVARQDDVDSDIPLMIDAYNEHFYSKVTSGQGIEGLSLLVNAYDNILYLCPSADITELTLAYPYEKYININNEKLTLTTLIEKYGIPFANGNEALAYYTSDGCRVIIDREADESISVRGIVSNDGVTLYTPKGGLTASTN